MSIFDILFEFKFNFCKFSKILISDILFWLKSNSFNLLKLNLSKALIFEILFEFKFNFSQFSKFDFSNIFISDIFHLNPILLIL